MIYDHAKLGIVIFKFLGYGDVKTFELDGVSTRDHIAVLNTLRLTTKHANYKKLLLTDFDNIPPRVFAPRHKIINAFDSNGVSYQIPSYVRTNTIVRYVLISSLCAGFCYGGYKFLKPKFKKKLDENKGE